MAAASKRLEKLIQLVDLERDAGRLTMDKHWAVTQATLIPLQADQDVLHIFMVGGGLPESHAEACSTTLIGELKKHQLEGSQALEWTESVKPQGQLGLHQP